MRTQLMCTSSQGDQPLNITWFKDDRQLAQQLEDKSSIEINEYAVFSSILTIHTVTSAHNGNYTCQIANRAGTVTFTAPLSVSGSYNITVLNHLNGTARRTFFVVVANPPEGTHHNESAQVCEVNEAPREAE